MEEHVVGASSLEVDYTRKGDIRSHVLDRETASSLDILGWRGAVMSPFYTDGDLAGTPGSFSPSVRRRRGSQAGVTFSGTRRASFASCARRNRRGSQVWRRMFSRAYRYRRAMREA
jgi:hypothetical protein